MGKHIFYSIIGVVLLLAGCIKIPAQNGTAGHYNAPGIADRECLTKESILPGISPAPGLQPGALDSRNFRVLIWNSHKGRSRIWQEDLERLSSLSDVVVLQEGYLTEDLQVLLDKKQFNWDITKAYSFNDIYTGVLTASRVKPDFLCSFRAPEPLSGIPKTVMITRYPLSDSDAQLVIANIHMINFSLDPAVYRAQLKKTAEVLAKHPGPMIISGDFNSWNSERLRILAEITKELGAREVVFDRDQRTTFMGRQVDHIFYRNLVPLEAVTEKVTTSDHNPMLITFRLADEL